MGEKLAVSVLSVPSVVALGGLSIPLTAASLPASQPGATGVSGAPSSIRGCRVPRTRSAKKQLRRGKLAAARNKSQRSALRTAVKKVRGGGPGGPAAAGSPEAAAAYAEAARLLDRAGRKRLIHPNTAARHKSRLAKLAKRK